MNLKAGYPFSLIQNGLVSNYPKLEKNLRADVVIMGGGISGALTAWHLIQRNIDCVLLDGRTIGLGSTCASTSILQYEIDVPLSVLSDMIGWQNAVRAYKLSYEAVKKTIKLAKDLGLESASPRQSLYYAAQKKDENWLRKEYEARKKARFQVSFIEEGDMPKVAGMKAPGAILSERAGELDAYVFTHLLLKDAIKNGLAVYDRSRINTIDHRKNSIELVTDNGSKIRAAKLIYANGYEVVNYIDINIVKLKSTYATVSESFADRSSFWPEERIIWNTADPYLYMRSTKDNRIIIGGRDENFYSPLRRDKLIVSKTRQLKRDINRLFPQIDFIPEFSWTGTFGTTRDGLPYIGPYKKLSNSYFALGFGGNGITFSLVAAEMIADLLKGKKNRDLEIFSFERI